MFLDNKTKDTRFWNAWY